MSSRKVSLLRMQEHWAHRYLWRYEIVKRQKDTPGTAHEKVKRSHENLGIYDMTLSKKGMGEVVLESGPS